MDTNMEKIVENCPWRFEDEDSVPWEQQYLCQGKFAKVYGRCTGPDCAPAYWAKAMFNIPLTELEDNQE